MKEKRNITAEMTTLMNFLNEGIIDVDNAAERLDVKREDLENALKAWKASKNEEEVNKKWILSVGRVHTGLERIL